MQGQPQLLWQSQPSQEFLIAKIPSLAALWHWEPFPGCCPCRPWPQSLCSSPGAPAGPARGSELSLEPSPLQARKAKKGGKDKKGGGKGKKGGKGKSSKKGVKKEVQAVDLFSSAAMLNAYYICHNAAAFLEFRGHPWPGSLKKKGKKRK
ncbi:small lysine-rich protein 1 [Molothrus ater]|uniref:small lysine-rich protein 1 n=1 Tax=Molothrus ater TaxID=84834 RepID=UPI0023E86D89|nr:small lysine-rich protein 1 [Molothrus ater]